MGATYTLPVSERGPDAETLALKERESWAPALPMCVPCHTPHLRICCYCSLWRTGVHPQVLMALQRGAHSVGDLVYAHLPSPMVGTLTPRSTVEDTTLPSASISTCDVAMEQADRGTRLWQGDGQLGAPCARTPPCPLRLSALAMQRQGMMALSELTSRQRHTGWQGACTQQQRSKGEAGGDRWPPSTQLVRAA